MLRCAPNFTVTSSVCEWGGEEGETKTGRIGEGEGMKETEREERYRDRKGIVI